MATQVPVLQEKDTGPSVTILQRYLSYWGLLSPKDIDGMFGPKTSAAVKEFQSLRSTVVKFADAVLTANGIVELQTWRELLKSRDIEIVKLQIHVTRAQAEAIFEGPITDFEFQELNQCLERFEITTPRRKEHFLSQCSHESGGLYYKEEIDDGWYIPRNFGLERVASAEGDYKYKGAGAIQLSMPENYRRFSEFMGDSLIFQEGYPRVRDMYPFSSAGFWWRDNKMNDHCDRGASCEEISAYVNRGQYFPGIKVNGLAERLRLYAIAQSVIPG